MLWREVLEVYETLIFSLTLAICLIQLVELQISCESGIFFSDDLYLYVFSIVMFWTCKQPNFSFLLWGIMTFDYSGSRLRIYPVYYTMSLQEAKLTEKCQKLIYFVALFTRPSTGYVWYDVIREAGLKQRKRQKRAATSGVSWTREGWVQNCPTWNKIFLWCICS